MKHLIKTMAFTLLGLVLSINLWGADVTITVDATSVTSNGVTVTCANSNGTAPADQGEYIRLYSNSTVTISSNNKNIVAMKIGWSKNPNKTYASASANCGEYSDPSSNGTTVVYGNWSGSAKTIVFTIASSGQKQIHSVEVTFESTAPTLTPSATSLAFGSVESGSDKSLSTLTVAGANLTNDITFNITGTNASYFTVTSSSPISKGSGTVAATAITVKYAPTATGSHSATLQIISGGAETKEVTLTGTGTAPAVKHDVKWYVNGSVWRTTQVTEGASITLPTPNPTAPSTCSDKVFMGWVNESQKNYESETTAPTYISNPQMGTADVNFYAIFADKEGTNDYSLVTNASNLSAGDVILLVNTTDAKGATTMGTNSYLGITNVTLNTNKDKVTDKGTASEFTLGGDATNGWSFNYSEGAIYITGTSNNNLATTGQYNLWSISISSNNATIISKQYTSRYLKYHSGNTRFSSYASNTSGSSAPQIFKKNITYSDYLTTCCTPLDAPTFGITPVTDIKKDAATITWNSVSNASGYEYSLDQSSWTNNGTSCTVTLSSLQSSHVYTFYVRAKGENSYCAEGSVASTSFTTLSVVSAGSCENGSVQVSLDNNNWSTSVDATAGTKIYLQATPASDTYVFSSWNSPTSGSINDNQLTGWTGDVTVTAKFVLASIPTLNTPTGMSTTPALKSATIQWNEVANASSYAVVCEGATIGDITTAEGVCSCELTGLTSGTDYTWTVQAIGDGENHKNSEVCAEQNFTTVAKSLTDLLLTPPEKLIYNKGENINLKGLNVTAKFDDETSADVTELCVLSISSVDKIDDPLPAGTPQFRATYTYGESTIWRGKQLTVNAKINWVVNGTPIDPTFASNGKVVLPATDPTSWPCIEDYPFFVGWTSETITGETTIEPSYISSTTDAVDEATYYAVFAAGTKGGAERTLVFKNTSSNGNTSYTGSWSETIESNSWQLTNFCNNSWGWNSTVVSGGRIVKAGHKTDKYVATIVTSAAIPTAINNVDVTVEDCSPTKINSCKLYVATDNSFTQNVQTITVDAATGTMSFIVPNPTTNSFYKLAFDCKGNGGQGSNGHIAISQVTYNVPDNYTAYITSCPTYYTITIDNQIQNGSVSVSPVKDSYPAGSTITLTANPVTTTGAGYQWKSWDVYYMDGDNKTTLNVVDNQFKMPAFDVIVSAVFEKMPASGITLDISSKQIPQDQQFTLTATISPATAYIENFEWVISGTGLSQVEENTITNNTVTATFVGSSILNNGSIKAKMGNVESAPCAVEIQSSETWEETDIKIATQPTTKAFNEGDNLDIAGLVVNKVETSNYSHERQTPITDYTVWIDETQVTDQAPYTFTHEDAVVGTKTVTIKYNTFSTSYDVTLTPKKTVTFHICGIANTPVTETSVGAGVSVPGHSQGVGDYVFAGWSKANPETETQTKPDYVTITNGIYTPTDIEEDIYAIYSVNKKGRVYGDNYYVLTGENSDVKKYIGAVNKDNKRFDVAESENDRSAFYWDGNLLYTYKSTTKYYIRYESSTDIIFKTAKNDATAVTESEVIDGKVTLQLATGRYLEYSSQSGYFRAYQTTNGLYKEKSTTQYISSNVDWYTSRPSTAVTPTLDWPQALTQNVQALSTVQNAATTNSTATITYESDNTDVATVDNDGTVHGLKCGTATITAKVAAVPDAFFAAEISYTISVTRIPTVINFVEDEQPITAKTVYAGNEYQLEVQTNSDAEVEYSLANNTSYASIDATGKLTVAAATGVWYSDKSCTAYAKQDQTDIYGAANTNNSGTKRATLTITIKDNRKEQKDMTFGDNADKEFNSNSGEQIFTQTVTGNVTAVTYSVKEGSTPDLVSVDATTGQVTVNTDIAGNAIIVATAAQEERTENGIKFIYQEKSVEYTIHVNYLRPVITYEGPALVGGKMRAPQTVTITAQEGDNILYTLDGTTPDLENDNAKDYKTPFVVSESMTIKAIAISSDMEQISLPAELTLTKDVPTTMVLVNNVETAETDLTLNAGDIVTIKAPACLFEYEVTDAYDRKIEGKGSAEATTNITFSQGGTYTLLAQPRWNITGGVGFEGEITQLAINVKGAAHLPLSYTGNGTGVKELPYAATSQNLGDYDKADKTKIQFKPSDGDVWMTINFLEAPKYLSFYAKHNKGSVTWEDAQNVLKVEQSADNTNWTTIATFDKDNAITTSEVQYEFNDTQLKENTRYIRWTYHQGNLGANLGLGNIVVKGDAYNVYQPNTELPEDYQGDVIVREGGELLVYNFEPFVLNGDLTIEAGGSVKTLYEMVVRNLTIEVGQTKSGQIKGDAALTITGEAYMQLEIDPATEASQGWYAIGVPFPVDALNGIYYGDTKLTNEEDYAIMDYHGDLRAQGQYGWKKYRGIMQPGIFYYFAVGDTDFKNLRFRLKKDGETYTLQNNYSVDYTDYPSENPQDAGYNGVANKTLEEVKIQKTEHMSTTVYTYDNANKVFGTTDLEVDQPTFLPTQPFFVTVDADGSFNLLTQTTPATAPRWMADGEVQTMSKVKVTLANDSYTDNYYVSASSEAKAEYEQLKDAVKMGTIDNSTKVPQIASINYNNTILSAEYAQLVNGQATISLLLYAPANGEYTIAATECKDGEIYLTQNGENIWNLKDTYTVTLTKGKTYEYGLRLVASAQAPTGSETIEADGNAQKLIKNSNFYIIKNGNVYSAQGQLLK